MAAYKLLALLVNSGDREAAGGNRTTPGQELLSQVENDLSTVDEAAIFFRDKTVPNAKKKFSDEDEELMTVLSEISDIALYYTSSVKREHSSPCHDTGIDGAIDDIREILYSVVNSITDSSEKYWRPFEICGQLTTALGRYEDLIFLLAKYIEAENNV